MRFSISVFALASALASGVTAAPYAQQQGGQGGATGGATGGRTGGQTGGQAGGQTGTTGGQTGTQGTHANPMNSIPAGNPSPISTPIAANLAACLAACQGNPSCVAYTFQSNVCNLYGATNAKRQTHDAPLNGVPTGNPNPIATPAAPKSDADCLAACQGNLLCDAWTFISGQCKLFGGASSKREAEPQQQGGAGGAPGGQGTHDKPMNAVPSGNPSPIATPSGPTDLAACLTACKGNPSCIAYTFTNNVCKLFG